MSSLVNLHTHSNLSDGSESPRDVVRLAAESGTKLMALTDHDMTVGVVDAIDEGKKLGVDVISASEISLRFQNKTLHVLGLGIDIENKELQDLLLHLRDFRRQGMIKKIEEIRNALPTEKQFDMDEFVVSQGEYFCISKSMEYLVDHKVVATKDDAWPMLKGVEVAARDVDVQKVIDTIHHAGGIAILAHPLGPVAGIPSITKDSEEQRKLLIELKQFGLDGIECYQLSHLDEDISRALQFCRDLEFLVTAGSDWHGPLSAKNDSIKNVVPNYQEHFGDFSVPDPEAQKIITTITSHLPADRLE